MEVRLAQNLKCLANPKVTVVTPLSDYRLLYATDYRGETCGRGVNAG